MNDSSARPLLRRRTKAWLFASTLFLGSVLEGCLGSAIALRFREAYAPGFIEGFSEAVSAPGQWESGLRRTWAAIFEGLGAIIEPRSSSSPQGGR